MDYLCAKFGDFSFSRFGFIVRTDRQNHTGGSICYTDAPIVGVSKYLTYDQKLTGKEASLVYTIHRNKRVRKKN